MLLSTSHKFIFVHIPKTAGSALHNALLPYATLKRRTLFGSALRRLPIVEDAASAHFRIHDTAKKIRTKLSCEVWDQYYSFAVVRNPFDHAISHYEYMKQYRHKNTAEVFAKLSFEQYLQYRLSPRRIYDRFFAKLPNQSYFVADNGVVLVDKIIKYENLAVEISRLSEKLLGTALDLKRTNVTKSRRIDGKNDYYKSQNAIDLVLELYSEDFDVFSYSRKPSFGSDSTFP